MSYGYGCTAQYDEIKQITPDTASNFNGTVWARYITSVPLPEEMEHQAENGELVYDYIGPWVLDVWEIMSEVQIKIYEHGVMTPDYFQGCNGTQLALPVCHHMTHGQLWEALDKEISDLWDSIKETHDAPDSYLLHLVDEYLLALKGINDKRWHTPIENISDNPDVYLMMSIEFSN